jgi:hypothetical protein
MEDFINDYKPQDHYDLERAERLSVKYQDRNYWNQW